MQEHSTDLFGEPIPENIPCTRGPRSRPGKSPIHREPAEATRTCSQCSNVAASDTFPWKKHRNGCYYRSRECRDCLYKRNKAWRSSIGRAEMRRNRLARKYGISREQYEAMMAAQQGKCAICGTSQLPIDPRTGLMYDLALDHDHATGKPRDFLCPHCNMGLGGFKDRPELFHLAIAYLKKHGIT